MQAIAIVEGINEKIKARLNTKSKIKQSPQQEKKIKSAEEKEGSSEDEEEEDEDIVEEDFDESVEDFDEYYADEILKISRFITFREPPSQKEQESSTTTQEGTPTEVEPPKAEANVAMIGSIDIPRGTNLTVGTKIVIFKDEKIDLKLKDIVEEKPPYRPKLPAPQIKSLSPNHSEANSRASFVLLGDNLTLNQKSHFNNKDIYIEDIKGGPTVEYFVSPDMMPGIARLYWDSAQAEFYIIPTYDKSPSPVIQEVKTADGNPLMEINAGQKKVVIMIYGNELYQNKSQPVVIPDVVGLVPKVNSEGLSNKEITVTLDIGRNIEPGIHTLIVATEGGLSNSWLFNILPPDKEEITSASTAIVSSSLTLLDIRTVENLLPLIDQNDTLNQTQDNTSKDDVDDLDDTGDDDTNTKEEEEPTEKGKLSVFANVDLETSWLLETTAMVGKITKTISEVVERQIPNVHAALVSNGNITFEGGSYQIVGLTNAMTKLVEPTYISNINLKVEGPKEEPEIPLEMAVGGDQARPEEQINIPKSPIELGFAPLNLIAVVKDGSDRFSDLDYATIHDVGKNTIDLVSPGLMDFHYEGDIVTQFIPPIISNELVSQEDQEKFTIPQGFSIAAPSSAKFRNIFMSNLDQFAELADLYTNDATIPKDKYDLPVGYMGLTYVEGTPVYDQANTLAGKGLLIIDTRGDNQGQPAGDVEISGDSKSPVDFSGILYIHGNLKISGNVTINGAVIVDNDSTGQVQISSNSIGKIIYNPASIKQTLLYTPFTTRPGTVMITNTPIDLSKYVQNSPELTQKLGASSVTQTQQKEVKIEDGQTVQELPPEEAAVEAISKEETTSLFEQEIKKKAGAFPSQPSKKTAEEELIDLF